MSFNRVVLKVAQENPEFRQALQEELSRTAASKDSLRDSIEASLGGMAEAMGKFFKSKYSKAMKGFSSPYRQGHMKMAVSSEINNELDKSRPGDLIITAEFDKIPTIEVFANFPKAEQFSRKIAFKVDASTQAVAKQLGPVFMRDLDYWMTAVARAYED